jgi:hypothetical protein
MPPRRAAIEQITPRSFSSKTCALNWSWNPRWSRATKLLTESVSSSSVEKLEPASRAAVQALPFERALLELDILVESRQLRVEVLLLLISSADSGRLSALAFVCAVSSALFAWVASIARCCRSS